MLVKELIAALQQQDPELEVIIDMFSDYAILDGVSIRSAVDQGGYVMNSHYTMSEESKAKEMQYLYLGNWSL